MRVRDKVTSEGNQVGVALLNNRFRAIGLKATCCDDATREDAAKILRSNRCLALRNNHVATHSGFDDVKIGKSETVKVARHIRKQRLGIAIKHPIPSSIGPIRTATRSAPHTEIIASTTSKSRRVRF